MTVYRKKPPLILLFQKGNNRFTLFHKEGQDGFTLKTKAFLKSKDKFNKMLIFLGDYPVFKLAYRFRRRQILGAGIYTVDNSMAAP